MFKSKCMTAAMLATLAGSAMAHGSYITVTFPSPIPPIHPLGNLYFPSSAPIEQPKLWNHMSPKERADIWPHLLHRMQRHYWTCMSPAERRAMYKLLSARARSVLRNRFVFQEKHPTGGPIPAHLSDDHDPQRPPRMTDEQRARLRKQVRDVTHVVRPNRDRIPR